MTRPPRLSIAAGQRRRLAIAIPTTLAVPVVLGAVAVAQGVDLRPLPMVLGGVGWVAALVLRAPVGIAASRLRADPASAQTIVTAASGPLEELVRLVVVLLLGRDLDTAVSIGLGWAAIEVLYLIVNGVVLVAVLSHDDPEAERLRALLPFPDAILESSPLWGAWERIWASALHVAFTLLIAVHPLLVLVTIPLHSATNLSLFVASRRVPFATVQLIGAAAAAVLLAVAVGLWRASPG